MSINSYDYQLTRHEQLQERVYTKVLESGLTVIVLPKPGYRKKHASLAAHYGALDRELEINGKGFMHLPDGIAHFLEHTLFEKEEGNASNLLSQLGASSNAYTSYTITNYLFNAVDNFPQALDLLLDFVQTPYFSEKTVGKERGIIEQELKMYDDMPDRKLVMNLSNALYSLHPVRVDIGGTVDSIKEITPTILQQCYGSFYHPSNMALFVIGDVEPEKIFDQVTKDQAKRERGPSVTIKRHIPDEPDEVNSPLVRHKMMTSTSRVAIGYKDRAEVLNLKAKELYRLQLLTGIIIRTVIGRSSKIYNQLYNEGLINETFGSYYDRGPGYGYTILGGETPDPDKLVDILQKGIEEFVNKKIQPKDFQRLKRSAEGQFISSFDSLGTLASSFLELHFMGVTYFDTLELLQSLTCEEANERLRDHFNPDRVAISIVEPINKEK